MINFSKFEKKSSFKHIPKSNDAKQNSNGRDESIVLNEIDSDTTHHNVYGGSVKKKSNVGGTNSSCRNSKMDSQINESNTNLANNYNTSNNGSSSNNIEYKPSKTDNIYKFYITRLKHSLIISFLLLIPIQNFFLCLISQFSEQV